MARADQGSPAVGPELRWFKVPVADSTLLGLTRDPAHGESLAARPGIQPFAHLSTGDIAGDHISRPVHHVPGFRKQSRVTFRNGFLPQPTSVPKAPLDAAVARVDSENVHGRN